VRFRAYIATSLDGYVATLDGRVKWLEPYDAARYGYEGFLRDIDTIVMGRRTFDQVLTAPEWPYGDKDVFVMTSRPLVAPPARTLAWNLGARRLISQLRESPGERDVWVLGGPTTIHGFRRNGAVDRYELFLLPVLLGLGIPLFVESRDQSALSLVSHRVFADGAVSLVYEPRQG